MWHCTVRTCTVCDILCDDLNQSLGWLLTICPWDSGTHCMSDFPPVVSWILYKTHMCRLQSFRNFKLTLTQKVTPQRATAFAFHPTCSKALVIAGDKSGLLALWDIVSCIIICGSEMEKLTVSIHIILACSIGWYAVLNIYIWVGMEVRGLN